MLSFVAKGAAATIFGVVVVAGLFYVRLMHGPISLNYLVGAFEGGIAQELSDTRVHVQTVALRLNDAGLLQFELGDVRVVDAKGEPLIMAPSALVSLSRRALLLGRIAVESLDLVSARLTLFYSEDGALSLKFSPSSHATPADAASHPAPSAPAALRGTVDAAQPAATAPADNDWMLGRIDLIKMLSEVSASARRRENASAYLREVGLRSATVIVDNGGRRSIWHVPQFDLDLDHRRTRSSIAGYAKVDSLAGPWELSFRSNEHVNSNVLNFTVAVRNLVPGALARSFPNLVGIEGLDFPLSADAKLEVSKAGEIVGGKIVIDAGPGKAAVPWFPAAPMYMEEARVELSYTSAARRFEIASAVLKWGDSRVQLTGSITRTSQGADGPGWLFDVRSTEGWLAPEPPQVQRLPIDQFSMRGVLAPELGKVALSEFMLRAGGAEVTAHGTVSNSGGQPKGQLEAKIGPMTGVVFKTLWPRWLAPQTRNWLVPRLARGNLVSGSFKVVHGAEPGTTDWAPVGAGDRMSLSIEGADIALQIVKDWPALEIPRGLLTVTGRSLEFAVPEATMALADGRKFALKGNLTADLDEPMPRRGHIAIKGQGPLTLGLEILDQDFQRSLNENGLTLKGIDGRLDGDINITFPLIPQVAVRDWVTEGRLHVSDGRMRNVLGSYDAQGVNATIELSANAAEAKAEFLIKGVPARATWQRVFDAPADRQPPFRVSANLDNSDRSQLGLDINDIVQGGVGVEISVEQDGRGERNVHLSADLSNAELFLESLAWRKPKGRPALFEFDLAKGSGSHPIELRNVKLQGENVAIAGWMGAGADFRVREFRFPQFSLNVVTSFEAHGKLRQDNVWDVHAKGPVYDGKDLFQSFFDVNAPHDRSVKKNAGVDLTAEIDTVVGFYETSLRGVRLTMQKRSGKMTQLDVRGAFVPNKQFEAALRHEGRQRLLVAKSNDAGQTFKLVGFYPHAVGGDFNLEVNLDGQGDAERTGLLTASRFAVLGDTISVQNLPDSPTRRNVVRERFEFDTLRAPFAVGHGQFVLRSASVDGPLVSATMQGKIDFRSRKMQVGGTFTPLSTLNKMFSEIPLFGDLLTGPKREGVFAINYLMQGGLENPEIIINPLSAVTPGITREFIQIAPQDPRIVPPKQQPAGKAEGGVRASSSPVAGPGKVEDSGWSSDTDLPAAKKR